MSPTPTPILSEPLLPADSFLRGGSKVAFPSYSAAVTGVYVKRDPMDTSHSVPL